MTDDIQLALDMMDDDPEIGPEESSVFEELAAYAGRFKGMPYVNPYLFSKVQADEFVKAVQSAHGPLAKIHEKVTEAFKAMIPNAVIIDEINVSEKELKPNLNKNGPRYDNFAHQGKGRRKRR